MRKSQRGCPGVVPRQYTSRTPVLQIQMSKIRPASSQQVTCHDITADKDANDSRNVQHCCPSEWTVNEPLDGVVKSIGRHCHRAPSFSHNVSAVGPPDPTAKCGLDCRVLRIPSMAKNVDASNP